MTEATEHPRKISYSQPSQSFTIKKIISDNNPTNTFYGALPLCLVRRGDWFASSFPLCLPSLLKEEEGISSNFG